jgi:hypothetical protein
VPKVEDDMVRISEYATNAQALDNDYSRISVSNDAVEALLSEEKKVLEAPGKIEAKLRGVADDLELSGTTIKLVGFIPKIGTALKTAANVADTVGEEIDRQADIMGALDDAWAVPRSVVSGAQTLQALNGVALSYGTQASGFRVEEADALAASIEGDLVPDGSRLAARMEAFNADAEAWFKLRGDALAKLDEAIERVGDRVAELADRFPDTGALDAAAAAVAAVFDPIQSALGTIERGLKNTKIVIVPEVRIGPVVITKEVSATLAEIVTRLDDFVTVIQNKVKSAIDGLLKKAGIDVGSIVDDLRDRLLDPLDPIFDAIRQGLDAAQDIVDALEQMVDEILQPLRDFVQYLENEFADTLFDNRFFGDGQLSTLDDTLVGGDGEDGIFGLQGDDALDGRGGDDFVFGGVGDDSM